MRQTDNIKLLYIDLFCGAGGTSTGVEHATFHGSKCAKVIACVNHDANAIASHAANHPDALHFTEDIRTLELSPLVAHTERLRQDIIWHKPNPMPEAVRDRCTKAHEYIFLLTKSDRYYFDAEAIKEPARKDNRPHMVHHRRIENGTYREKYSDYTITPSEQRNKRDVWTVSTKPEKSAHFAAYPKELIEPCVLAGCPNGGIILDPFMGTGTTAMVARMYGRNYIGFEINAEYMSIINKKIQVTPNMFYQQ